MDFDYKPIHQSPEYPSGCVLIFGGIDSLIDDDSFLSPGQTVVSADEARHFIGFGYIEAFFNSGGLIREHGKTTRTLGFSITPQSSIHIRWFARNDPHDAIEAYIDSVVGRKKQRGYFEAIEVDDGPIIRFDIAAAGRRIIQARPYHVQGVEHFLANYAELMRRKINLLRYDPEFFRATQGLVQLQQALDCGIARQEYELCAKLRDEIAELQNHIAGKLAD